MDGHSSEDGARQAMTQLWTAQPRPAAVVVANNQMMIGVLAFAYHAGVGIPEDLALVGFDDFPWADYFRPGLTVMAQPTGALGQQAAELMLSRLASPDLPARHMELKPRFMHRESCGCPVNLPATTNRIDGGAVAAATPQG